MPALRLLFVASLLTVVAACSRERERGKVPHDGAISDPDAGMADAGPTNPPSVCFEDLRPIFLVANDGTLLRFDPERTRVTELGELDCPSEAGATPFSMSVDRTATAWVLYNSGELFRASLDDASCGATAFDGAPDGFRLFGMGFSTRTEGGDDETLFVAGRETLDLDANTDLASLDTATLALEERGGLPGFPELTSSGAGDLWAFFARMDPPTIRRLDKDTGETLESIAIGALPEETLRYAFAFWGGRFYLFAEGEDERSTTIYRVDREFGTAEAVMRDIGYTIVGAGVSTCAPYELI